MCTALTEHLADSVATLDEHAILLIAELRSDGVVVWTVQRDHNGTPCARRSAQPEPWTSLYHDGVLAEDEFRRITRQLSGSRILYVEVSGADRNATQTLDWLSAVDPGAATFKCATPLTDVLKDVITKTPLTRWYDLVVLTRSKSGRLAFGRHKLFPPQATSGDKQPLTVRCARSDVNGTAFAVISSRSRERDFELLSVQSAKIPPGSYQVVAELRRPGLVVFRNLPSILQDDHRDWPDIVASVPDRLDVIEQAQLICLIEVTGTTDQFSARLHRTRQLIGLLADEDEGSSTVSIIAYGSHSVDVGEPDGVPQVVVWGKSLEEGLAAIDRMERLGPAEASYGRAAQLECALVQAARQLDLRKGRPAIVAIGGRPPFPRGVESSEIIPCPKRHDWSQAIGQLRALPGATFGAIHDASIEHPAWKQLGADASAELGNFNDRAFASGLGLTRADLEYVPFPLIEA